MVLWPERRERPHPRQRAFTTKDGLARDLPRFAPGIRLTSHQSLLFTDVAEANRAAIEQILHATWRKAIERDIKRSSLVDGVRRVAHVRIVDYRGRAGATRRDRRPRGRAARLGLSQETFTVRMTGCPNGCARPYNSDIGLVGKAAGKYTVLLGGRLLGNRMNVIYKDMVPAEDLVSTLVPVLAYFKQDRQAGETFGDFCHRKGVEDLQEWAGGYADQVSA